MGSLTVLRLSLLYGAVLTAFVTVGGSLIGYLVAGLAGLLSALAGAVLAAAFMALTAASIVVANRLAPEATQLGRYFGIVSATWILKLVAFAAVAVVLRGQPWMHPYLFFGAALAAVIGSLAADGVAMQRARVPYVGDIALPGDSADEKSRRGRS